jgi:hypothetical protein
MKKSFGVLTLIAISGAVGGQPKETLESLTRLCALHGVGTRRAWGDNRAAGDITVDDTYLEVMGGRGFRAAWVEGGEQTRNRAGLDAWEDWHVIAA